MTQSFACPLPTPPAKLGGAHRLGRMVGMGDGTSSWSGHGHAGGAIGAFAGLPEMPAAGASLAGVPVSSISIPPLPSASAAARVATGVGDAASPPSARKAPPARPARADRRGDFTDADLAAALAPLLDKAGTVPADLEPMLRTTVRRALAEHDPQSRPFRQPGWFDRMGWHMRALVTSRSYEDIIFEKTHRFQVEEVYLYDLRTFAMISFASSDPARHGSARRVEATSRRIAHQLAGSDGVPAMDIELTSQTRVLTRSGSLVAIAAVVRGEPREFLHSDLEFAVRRIEGRYSADIIEAGKPMLDTLQPFLEDCLLIQAPVGR